MALSSYGDLRNAVAAYLNRSDLASYIPDFVKLAESRIHYGSSEPFQSQPVRVLVMQSQAAFTPPAAPPDGFLEVISLVASSGSTSWKLEYADSGTFQRLANCSDLPTVYTFLNSRIQTAGTGPATFTLNYWDKFSALTADADTNWLLTNAPSVYLFASLLESAPFIMDGQSAQLLPTWLGMYRSAVNSLNMVTQRPGPLRVVAA